MSGGAILYGMGRAGKALGLAREGLLESRPHRLNGNAESRGPAYIMNR